MKIDIKRIYDPPGGDDGFRILVDRLWSRSHSAPGGAPACAAAGQAGTFIGATTV